MLAAKIDHVLERNTDDLPNLEQQVVHRQPSNPFKAPTAVGTGIKTADTDQEGEACPLVVYRSKAAESTAASSQRPTTRRERSSGDAGGKSHQHTTHEQQPRRTTRSSNGSEITIDNNATATWTDIKNKLEALRTLIANVQKSAQQQPGTSAHQ
ncbi:hypothetical protein ERJ75_000606400 [Trypanosoma vivax]|nr:hypothetical protein ERJ75_000606400 [Trypanosoma vivax]